MLETLCWWLICVLISRVDVGDSFYYVGANIYILVTCFVTNIEKLSPTDFVSNIRHQHRCSPINPCFRSNFVIFAYFWMFFFLQKWSRNGYCYFLIKVSVLNCLRQSCKIGSKCDCVVCEIAKPLPKPNCVVCEIASPPPKSNCVVCEIANLIAIAIRNFRNRFYNSVGDY